MPGRRKKKSGPSQPAKPRARTRAPERNAAQEPTAAPEPPPLSDLVRTGQRAIVTECLRLLEENRVALAAGKAPTLDTDQLYYIQRTLDGEARRGEPASSGSARGFRVVFEIVKPRG